MPKSKLITAEPVKRDWDESGQVCFVDGYAYGLTENLATVRIGNEADVRAYIAQNKTVVGFRPPLSLKIQQETNHAGKLATPTTKQDTEVMPPPQSPKMNVSPDKLRGEYAGMPLFDATMAKEAGMNVRSRRMK